MEIESRRRAYRAGAWCLVIGSACSGVTASSILSEAVGGDHNVKGKMLLIGFGLFLLLISVFVFVYCMAFLKSSKTFQNINK